MNDVHGAAVSRNRMFAMSTQTLIKSSIKPSHFPLSSSGRVTHISLAWANGMSAAKISGGGMNFTKSEHTFDSSQSLLSRRSLMQSVTMSETVQKSEGHGAPPNGNRNEMST